ncbi:MAG: nicotinate (nicotinamide) nucleotide adenylyltransferase [Fibrobacteres bacterium]|nr:nicotinate (nicotinamide) nucleotide adenylyltransferase [Fibrobacterota bacterium]
MADRRVGIFGGVFNPVHNGHVAIVSHAIHELNLSKLYVVPCSDPPHKPIPSVSALERFRMTDMAFGDTEDVIVSQIEIKRPGRSYTIDTIREIQALEPDARPVLIIGADNIDEIQKWKEPDAIYHESDIAAFTRPGHILHDKRIILVEMEPYPISSTEIREKLQAGTPVDKLIPSSVLDYIKLQKLYI